MAFPTGRDPNPAAPAAAALSARGPGGTLRAPATTPPRRPPHHDEAATNVSPAAPGEAAVRGVRAAVRTARDQLGMDVGILGAFIDGYEVFEVVDGDTRRFRFVDEGRLSLDATYCLRAVRGTIPPVIPDTRAEPRVASLTRSTVGAVASYIGVPVTLLDGRLYGALWCMAAEARPALGDADVRFLRSVAAVVAGQLETDPAALGARRDAFTRQLEPRDPRMVLQPVVALADGSTAGYEALARFAGVPERSPAAWFAEAATVGQATELETLAVTRALERLPSLPADTFLSVNASPTTVEHVAARGLLDGADLGRVVVEVTEHAPVADYARLQEALAPLRRRGVRLAIDDVGAGYASMTHVLRLEPDLLKLDGGVIRDVDRDGARRALTAALVQFAADIGAAVVGEGVERAEELDVLRGLGVQYGQGYHLGRPGAVADAADAQARVH